MRPYKFRIRLSSKRLNVTRLGKGPAAALRAAAWLSLGSASSDIELMERLLYDFRPDPFFGKPKVHLPGSRRAGMIAPTAGGCKRAVAGAPKFAGDGLAVTPGPAKNAASRDR